MLAGLLLLVAACASSITSDVTRFNKLGKPSGETVRIVAKDPALEGSLEFQSYADLIGRKLGALGYRPAAAGSDARLIVKVGYEVGAPQEKSRYSYGSYPYYGYASYGYGYFGHGFYDPFYPGYGYGYGYDGYGYNYTVYPRKLEMDIVRAGDNEMLFQGVVDSIGRNQHLNEVMPYLIEAMFNGFPGEDGKTYRVKIEVVTARNADNKRAVDQAKQ